jgi:hypothetical protein
MRRQTDSYSAALVVDERRGPVEVQSQAQAGYGELGATNPMSSPPLESRADPTFSSLTYVVWPMLSTRPTALTEMVAGAAMYVQYNGEPSNCSPQWGFPFNEMTS